VTRSAARRGNGQRLTVPSGLHLFNIVITENAAEDRVRNLVVCRRMEVGLWVVPVVGGIVNSVLEDLDGRLQVGSGQMRHFQALDEAHGGGQAERGGEKQSGSEPCQDGGETPPFPVLTAFSCFASRRSHTVLAKNQ